MDTKSKADNAPSDLAAVLTALEATLSRLASVLESRHRAPTSWDDMPITLNIKHMSAITGICENHMRGMWHSKGFPRIPQRYGAMELKADKELFREWWLFGRPHDTGDAQDECR